MRQKSVQNNEIAYPNQKINFVMKFILKLLYLPLNMLKRKMKNIIIGEKSEITYAGIEFKEQLVIITGIPTKKIP